MGINKKIFYLYKFKKKKIKKNLNGKKFKTKIKMKITGLICEKQIKKIYFNPVY
jgi:hypothetical protein